MIVKFTKDTEVSDRLFLAGQSRDFDKATADKLIKDGVALDPSSAKTEQKTEPVIVKAKKK